MSASFREHRLSLSLQPSSQLNEKPENSGLTRRLVTIDVSLDVVLMKWRVGGRAMAGRVGDASVRQAADFSNVQKKSFSFREKKKPN